MPHPNYHFYIPNYTTISNGIVILWEAAYEFSNHRPVSISSFHYGEKFCPVPEKYRKLIKPHEYHNNCIVVYPDCVAGNPLNSRLVARYLMAKPFILNNTWFDYGQNEFVFAYSNAVNSAMPQYNLIDPNLITLRKYKTTKKNNTLCIYMGKCRFGLNFKKYISLLDKFDEFVIITRTNPSKKEILYECIANSKLLLSFDPLSSICYESTLLGTPVLLGDSVFEAEYKNYNYPLYGFNYSADEIDFYKDEFYYHATDCLDEQISKNTDKTINIINKIESALLYKKYMLPDLYDMKLSDLNFFNDVWKCSPMYNCTTKNSIFRYHLICNRPILYVFLLQLFRFKLCVISATKAIIFYFTWSNIKRMMLIYLGLSNDIIYLNYIKKPGAFKIKISPINCEPIDNSSSDAISIKKQTLKKLWNL